ncbi:MAG: dienelactone hydrolase family protein [Deltaproteobacteria bacterium]|nr:dienelactone hydrolase family protein [Deltaproteobacteria bacterium]
MLVISGSILAEEASKEEVVKTPDIKYEEVTYTSNEVTFKGYLAYDNNIEGKRPGVLVVHEWWGLNDHARQRANMLAELGYTALAVDMYGEAKQAANPDEAGKMSGMVMGNLDDAQARFEAALELLKNQKTVDPQHIAAIGYCFGGAVVLNLALRGVDLDGVASFHGILPTTAPAKPAEVKANVLVFHGADDQFVSKEQIEQFKQVMKNANANFDVITYPNAKHSFTVPEADANAKKFNIPLGYNAEADKDSWEKLQEFFKKIFKKES